MCKPPLGIMPKYVHRQQRICAIVEAVCRFLQADYPIPVEWIEEYNQLIKESKATP